MVRILCAALLAGVSFNVANAKDLPDDTIVRAMTIHPSNDAVITSSTGTFKECRDGIAEMMEQLKQEDDPSSDGTIYVCIPVDPASEGVTLLEASRFKRICSSSKALNL